MTILPKLDHSKSKLNAAFGISDYDKLYIKSAIIFELLSVHIMVNELYDDPKEAPSNMTTTTGLLERAMSHIDDKTQQIFMLMVFQETFDQTRTHMEMAASVSKEMEITDLKSTLQHFAHKIMAQPIALAMEAIREVGHDFDAFIKKVLPESKFDENGNMIEEDHTDSEIDRLIKKALRNQDLDTDNED